MARVQGVKERVHLPIYDSVTVGPGEQLLDAAKGQVLRFFVDVQRKSKLETNLQSASLLPHYNTFEARALRVVLSDFPPKVKNDEATAEDAEYDVVVLEGDEELAIDSSGKVEGESGFGTPLLADLEVSLTRLWEALEEARASEDGYAEFLLDEEGVEVYPEDGDVLDPVPTEVLDRGASFWLSRSDIERLILDVEGDAAPPLEQVRWKNGSGNVISKLIYSSVTSLFVGEKVMIQMPTWFFPAGAGAYSDSGSIITHGEPSPMATFRFAEPIFIDQQQNFRVEVEVPDTGSYNEIKRLYGPLSIWVVLDGYMTRDVQ